jgi:hypothetical protein
MDRANLIDALQQCDTPNNDATISLDGFNIMPKKYFLTFSFTLR